MPSLTPTATATAACSKNGTDCWAYWKVEVDFPYNAATNSYNINAVWTARYGYIWHQPVITITQQLDCQTHGNLTWQSNGQGAGKAVFDGSSAYITCSVPSMKNMTSNNAEKFDNIIPIDKEGAALMPGPMSWVAGLVENTRQTANDFATPIFTLGDQYGNYDVKYVQHINGNVIESRLYLSQQSMAPFSWQPQSTQRYFWAGHQLTTQTVDPTWGAFLQPAFATLQSIQTSPSDVTHVAGPLVQPPFYALANYKTWYLSTKELTLYIGYDPQTDAYFQGMIEKVGGDPVKFGNS